jgi:glycosyltransferase involved in cell wall biosynthesis
VRVFEWLDRVSEPYLLSTYISQSNSKPSSLLRRPLSVMAAERRLRRMAKGATPRLLLHREASPLSRGDLERRLLANSQFAVYDFDDALQWDWGDGAAYRRVAPKALKALTAVQNADRVIAGNSILADWASDYNDDVIVIPSCVSPDAYHVKSDYEVRDPPRLGWIGSVDNEANLCLIRRALHEIHRRTGARLTLIGTTRPRLGDLEHLIDRVAWSETVQHSSLAEFDLGIMPLRDDPQMRGKCGYKLLQYSAAGIPSIGSPVGTNEKILSRLGMPSARTEDDWLDAVLDLLERSSEDRNALGRHAREVTSRHYSFDAWLPRWRSAVGIEGP